MNKLKIRLAIAALVIGVSGAFTFNSPAAHASSRQAMVWFTYNGAGLTNPANYTKVSGTPSCNSGSILCAIEGADNGTTHPSQATVDNPSARRNKVN